MQIKSLYIHNYKSFYDTTIEFGKFNIIVAQNNAGKSNLIDVLEFINIASEYDIERAIKEKGGIDNIKNYKNNEDKIVIKVCYNYIIKFTITTEYSQLTKFYNKKEFSIHKYFNNQKLVNKNRPKNTIYINFGAMSKIYYFQPEIIKQKSHLEAEEKLEKNGSNLGKNLAFIKKENINNFEKISNSLIGIVEEIDEVDVTSIVGQYILTFKEKQKDININIISDGTINLVATITALNQAIKNDIFTVMLAFEEPERHLHLKAVNYLLDEFRNHEKQILITTHSSEILNSAKIEEIIFMYRDSYGDTQTIRADKIKGLEGKLKRLGSKKDLSISELIDENILGDLEDYE